MKKLLGKMLLVASLIVALTGTPKPALASGGFGGGYTYYCNDTGGIWWCSIEFY